MSYHQKTLDVLALISLGPKADETADDFALRAAEAVKAAVIENPHVGGPSGVLDPLILRTQAEEGITSPAVDLAPVGDFLSKIDNARKQHGEYVAAAKKHNAALVGAAVQLGIAGLTAATGPGGASAAGAVIVPGLVKLAQSALADDGS